MTTATDGAAQPAQDGTPQPPAGDAAAAGIPRPAAAAQDGPASSQPGEQAGEQTAAAGTCWGCKAGGLLLLGLAGALAYVGADLITHGALSRFFAGVRGAEEAGADG